MLGFGALLSVGLLWFTRDAADKIEIPDVDTDSILSVKSTEASYDSGAPR